MFDHRLSLFDKIRHSGPIFMKCKSSRFMPSSAGT